MHRVGIAASKMAQGNLFKYNLFVVGISTFFSFIIFLISAFSVLAVLLVISIFTRNFSASNFNGTWSQWGHLIKMSLLGLASVIMFLNIWAIAKNIKCSTHNK